MNSFKSKTRILAGLAAVLLTAGLTACGGAGGESKIDRPVREAEDFGGYEFVFASHWSKTYDQEAGNSAIGDEIRQRIQDVEKKYNCHISFRGSEADTFSTDFATAVASGEKYGDVVETHLWWFEGPYRSNFIRPLSEVPEINWQDDTKWNGQDWFTRDGKAYGSSFTTWYFRNPVGVDNMMFYNPTILESSNQPDPQELLKKGEWTWDNFRSILKAVTKDTDGDGVPNVYGLSGMDHKLEAAALWSNSVREIMQQTDGKFAFGYENESAYEAIQFAADLVNKDKVYKNIYDGVTSGQDWLDVNKQFKENQYAFMIYTSTALTDPDWLPAMEADWKLVPFPKGPKGNDYDSVKLENNSTGFVFTTTNPEQDLRKSAIIFDELTEPFGDKTWQKYFGDTYFRDDTSFEIYEKMAEAVRYDYAPAIGIGFNYGVYISNIYTCTRLDMMTPAEAIDTLKENAKTMIDENLNSKPSATPPNEG